MKNFLLGILFAASFSSVAVDWQPDGSATLTREEVEQTRVAFYQLQTNFDIAVEQVRELRKRLDILESAHCI